MTDHGITDRYPESHHTELENRLDEIQEILALEAPEPVKRAALEVEGEAISHALALRSVAYWLGVTPTSDAAKLLARPAGPYTVVYHQGSSHPSFPEHKVERTPGSDSYARWVVWRVDGTVCGEGCTPMEALGDAVDTLMLDTPESKLIAQPEIAAGTMGQAGAVESTTVHVVAQTVCDWAPSWVAIITAYAPEPGCPDVEVFVQARGTAKPPVTEVADTINRAAGVEPVKLVFGQASWGPVSVLLAYNEEPGTHVFDRISDALAQRAADEQHGRKGDRS